MTCGVLRVSQRESKGRRWGEQWDTMVVSSLPLPARRRSREAEVERNSAKPSHRRQAGRSERRTCSSSDLEHRNESRTAGGDILFIMAIFTYGGRLCCAHNTQNTYMARGEWPETHHNAADIRVLFFLQSSSIKAGIRRGQS